MPNAFVFPGGVVSLTDFAAGWKDHFKACGYNNDDLEELVLKDVDRPILMKADVNESITRDIALRYSTLSTFILKYFSQINSNPRDIRRVWRFTKKIIRKWILKCFRSNILFG